MDDLIRRQDAIDALDKDPMGGLNYNRILNNLPSAQPDKDINVPCTDTISRQDAIAVLSILADKMDSTGKTVMEQAVEVIRDLRSVQKTGEWMWVQYDANPEIGNWHCSECRFMPSAFNLARKHLNYCPNCGAYMKGEEDE